MPGFTESFFMRFSQLLTNNWWLLVGTLLVGIVFGWLLCRLSSIRRIATLEAMLEMEIQSSEERVASMHQAFSGLSAQALQANNAQFIELARQTFARYAGDADHSLKMRQQAVEQLVSPLKDALTQTEKKIAEFDLGQKENQGQLKNQIQNLSEQHVMMAQETRRLVNALRRPEVRGQWGELSLRRLVELSGMVPHCDFSEQVTTNDGLDRPDMIIHLPGDRQVIVDAKAPMDAFLSSLEADRDVDKERYLDLHATQVKKRVSALSSRGYWASFVQSPEFVVLYIPGDQFLNAALDRRPALLEEALEQNIILATPSSLVALLRTIAHGWSQQKLNHHALEIRHAAEEYHQRLATFSEHFEGLGKHLSRLVEAYNQSVGSFERKLMPIAKQFSDLGLRKNKSVQVPKTISKEKLIDRSSD